MTKGVADGNLGESDSELGNLISEHMVVFSSKGGRRDSVVDALNGNGI